MSKRFRYRQILLRPPPHEDLQKGLKIKDYEIEKKIGEGAFARVFHVIGTKDRKSYALKIMRNVAEYKINLKRELEISKLLTARNGRNCNIVRCFDLFKSDYKLYYFLLYEFCEGTNL